MKTGMDLGVQKKKQNNFSRARCYVREIWKSSKSLENSGFRTSQQFQLRNFGN